MPSAAPLPHDAPLLRPWLWAWTGLALCLLAALALLAAGATLESARLGLVWLGLLAAGIGVALRFRATQLSRLQSAPGVAHLALAVIFALVALALSVNLVASWFGVYLLGFFPGLALVVWALVAPMSARAAWQALERLRTGAPLSRAQECALILVVGAATALVACAALSSPYEGELSDWFTLQRFLFVLGVVALAAAPLTAVDDTVRRVVVSGLIVFHLLGIVTAALGAPPTPWVVTQLWTRIYRPYLEFLYLNNAYHFYSPEPGPPSHLWFRLYFTDENNQAKAEWYKIPALHDDGRQGHQTALIYQRYLSVTENAMPFDSIASDNPEVEKIAERRWAWTPQGAKKEPIVGQAPPRHELVVPTHPEMTKSQQYRPPQGYVKRFLESYTRHVFHKFESEHPNWKVERVRVYRIIHRIPPTESYLIGVEATDPEFYLPIYLGEFDRTGKLLNPDDPLLYWILPILREPPRNIFSTIRDWTRRHAGDPYWIRVVHASGFTEWVDDDNRPAPD